MQVVGQVNIGTNIENANTVNVVNGKTDTTVAKESENKVQTVVNPEQQSTELPDEQCQEMDDCILTDTSNVLFFHNEQYDPVDYIRIFNAMFELGYFVDKNGVKPNKADFFNKMGNVVGLNLSHYSTNLSRSITQSNDFSEAETTKLFDSLKKKALDYAEIVKKKYKEKHNMR